jgi:hypothetical protein
MLRSATRSSSARVRLPKVRTHPSESHVRSARNDAAASYSRIGYISLDYDNDIVGDVTVCAISSPLHSAVSFNKVSFHLYLQPRRWSALRNLLSCHCMYVHACRG